MFTVNVRSLMLALACSAGTIFAAQQVAYHVDPIKFANAQQIVTHLGALNSSLTKPLETLSETEYYSMLNNYDAYLKRIQTQYYALTFAQSHHTLENAHKVEAIKGELRFLIDSQRVQAILDAYFNKQFIATITNLLTEAKHLRYWIAITYQALYNRNFEFSCYAFNLRTAFNNLAANLEVVGDNCNIHINANGLRSWDVWVMEKISCSDLHRRLAKRARMASCLYPLALFQ